MSKRKDIWKPVHAVTIPAAVDNVNVVQNHSEVRLFHETGSLVVDFGLRKCLKLNTMLNNNRWGSANVWYDTSALLIGGRDSTTGEYLSTIQSAPSSSSSPSSIAGDPNYTNRYWASAVRKSKTQIILIGGQNESGVLDSIVVYDDERWKSLTTLPAGKRSGAATHICNNQLFVLGGYDGDTWKTDCHVFDFEARTWKELAPMDTPVCFGKVVRVSRGRSEHLLVAGESEYGDCTVQCLDLNSKSWIWEQSMNVETVEVLCLKNATLFCIGKREDRYGAYQCQLGDLDETRFGPTSISGHSGTEILKEVKDVHLPNGDNGISRYTGQMKKVGDSYIPHGEGLEIWADETGRFYNLSERRNSYYRGSHVNGYRDGMGEMYLKEQDQMYIGQFQSGSWHGLGRLESHSQGFLYFGNFIAGERTGYGRCAYRAHSSAAERAKRAGIQTAYRRQCYTGYWENGLAHGKGTITDESGQVIKSTTFVREDLTGIQ